MDMFKHIKLNKIANYWDKHVGEHIESFAHWESNAPVMLHQNFRVSCDINVNALSWFWNKYGPFRCMASLGTGSGLLEKHVCNLKDPEATIVGYDISPHSLSIAKTNCLGFQNVYFEVADLNTKEWQQDSFDVVFAHGALHHVESLDWALNQIKFALKPTGLLYVNDYVGPQRFQWSDVQMKFANELLKEVPRQWVRKEVTRCDPILLKKQDPSEAACSNFIEDTIFAYFDIIERKPRGGDTACSNIWVRMLGYQHIRVSPRSGMHSRIS